MAFKQQKCIPLSSGGWKLKIIVPKILCWEAHTSSPAATCSVASCGGRQKRNILLPLFALSLVAKSCLTLL